MAAPSVPLPRTLKYGSPPGEDWVAVKRAISRAGFWKWVTGGEFTEAGTKTFVENGIKRFQKAKGLKADGVYGDVTHNVLRTSHAKNKPAEWAFDQVAVNIMKELANKELATTRALLKFCRQFDAGYVYGGEHDMSFLDDDPHDGFDCSSSVSYVLWKFGLLGLNHAVVSTYFKTWGLSGRGKYMTIHANYDHVWIEFTLPEGYFRFDTSPHGDGARGPRVRTVRRSDAGFTHRHHARY